MDDKKKAGVGVEETNTRWISVLLWPVANEWMVSRARAR